MKFRTKLFPEKGQDASSLLKDLNRIKTDDTSWKSGRVFGYVFYPGDEVARMLDEVYRIYSYDNALSPSLFNSLVSFENETVGMIGDLLNGGPDIAGCLTSGGSESIMMVIKTFRDLARHDHPGIINPEIIIPVSAHPAFDKSAHYLNVKVVHVPLSDDKRVDFLAMEKAITPDTILLVGSAPGFPHGVVDPIAEIGMLALKYGIPFHVDACMGGLMLPFVEDLGYQVPLFDFRVPGVTSISVDIHKYGYSPKGASVVLYLSHEIRKHQYFVSPDWPGGIYGSSTVLGSRGGGPIAVAWAVISHFGYEGYLRMAYDVMEATRKLQKGISAIPGLHVVSNPEMSVFAFTSEQLDIFAIGDELTSMGWHLDRLQFPKCLHVTVSFQNAGHADEFLEALNLAVENVASGRIRNIPVHLLVTAVKGLSYSLPENWFRKISSKANGMLHQGKRNNSGKSAAMYGIASGVDNRKNVHDMVLDVMDSLYTLK